MVMKGTKVMLCCIVTFLVTWVCMGLVGAYLCECSLREVLSSQGCLMLMVIFGWIPTTIVGMDVKDKLKGN